MDVYEKITPYHQAAISVALGFLFMLTCLGFEDTLALRPEKPWVFASTFLLFYAIFNIVFSFNAKNTEKYWTQAVVGFVASVLGLSAFAYLISGLSINDAGSIRWIFIVITVSYLIFMSMARAMRFIVEFAQKEEWNQPNIKKKKDERRR